MFCRRIPLPMGCTVAFAGDVAIALRELLPGLMILRRCLLMLQLAAALAFHPGKLILIPLWAGGAFEVKRLLVESIPAWSRALVSDRDKMRGIYTDPSAHNVRWEAPAAKFWARGLAAKACTAGFTTAARQHAIFAFPALAHVAQMSEAPQEVMVMESRLLLGLTRGPFHVFVRRP